MKHFIEGYRTTGKCLQTGTMLVGLLAAAGVNSGKAAHAAPVYNATNGHYYEVVAVPSGIGWTNARTAAEGRTYLGGKGHLATLTSAEENQFIIANFLTAPHLEYWIGGYQDASAPDYSEPAGGWRWITGEVFNYGAWRLGEPNNALGYPPAETFLHIKEDGQWNDLPANAIQQGYIVEYEPNQAPVATNDSYTLYTSQAKSLVVNAPGALTNDSDAEGSTLTATLVNAPSKGTVQFDADGSFVYTPSRKKKNGTVTFTYQVSDGYLVSSVATVTINIAKKPPKPPKPPRR